MGENRTRGEKRISPTSPTHTHKHTAAAVLRAGHTFSQHPLVKKQAEMTCIEIAQRVDYLWTFTGNDQFAQKKSDL